MNPPPLELVSPQAPERSSILRSILGFLPKAERLLGYGSPYKKPLCKSADVER